MDERLIILTASALSGLASQPRASHREADDAATIGKRAVELARAALAELDDQETTPRAKKGR